MGRKALRKLLNIESCFQKQRENQRAKLMNRQAESEKFLNQLKSLQKEGEGRHDTRVQEIEQKNSREATDTCRITSARSCKFRKHYCTDGRHDRWNTPKQRRCE
jgi:predicted nuclease with TOPRIM domain